MKRGFGWITAAVIVSMTVANAHAQYRHYAEEFGWFFVNFDTPILEWDRYRETFIGIPPERDPVSNGFEVLFYDQVYREELSSGGNCYGLSLMSLLMRKKGGHLGYCLPVHQYAGDSLPPYNGPSDPVLLRRINQMHGHQVNLPSLRFYLDIISQGKNKDGVYAWQQADYYLQRDDFVMVSITGSTSPQDGGHTMVVYDISEVMGEKRIWLYDPNRSWYNEEQRLFYTANIPSNASNCIRIEDNGDWWFEKASDDLDTDGNEFETWSGGPGGGGNIMIIPVSVAAPRTRSPVSLGLDSVAEFVNTFTISGEGAELRQVTAAGGRRLFQPGGKEIDIHPDTGIRNVVPWFPSEGGSRYTFETYFQLGAPKGALNFEVQPGAEGYRAGIGGRRGVIQIVARNARGLDGFAVAKPGTPYPSLELRNTGEAESFDVTFTQIVRPGAETRTFKLENLQIQPRAELRLGIGANQSELIVSGPRTAAVFDLTVIKNENGAEESARLTGQRIEAGEAAGIGPRGWDRVAKETILIRKQQGSAILDADFNEATGINR